MIRKNGGDITNSNKSTFELLIGKYALEGKGVNHISKEGLVELMLAFLEKKSLAYPNSFQDKNDVDLTVKREVLEKLSSPLYNNKHNFFESMKEVVIESQICDVGEILDEAIEEARNRYVPDEYHLDADDRINLLSIFNATKKMAQSTKNEKDKT